MARLPVIGSDEGEWGTLLNDFLLQSHRGDGSLKDNAVAATTMQDNTVATSKLQDNAITTAKVQDNSLTTAKLQDDAVTAAKLATSNNPANGQVLGYSGGAMAWTAASSGTGAKVFVQSTDPGVSAQDGDIWIDTSI